MEIKRLQEKISLLETENAKLVSKNAKIFWQNACHKSEINHLKKRMSKRVSNLSEGLDVDGLLKDCDERNGSCPGQSGSGNDKDNDNKLDHNHNDNQHFNFNLQKILTETRLKLVEANTKILELETQNQVQISRKEQEILNIKNKLAISEGSSTELNNKFIELENDLKESLKNVSELSGDILELKLKEVKMLVENRELRVRMVDLERRVIGQGNMDDAVLTPMPNSPDLVKGKSELGVVSINEQEESSSVGTMVAAKTNEKSYWSMVKRHSFF